MTSRKQPGATFWATVVLVAGLLLYSFSYGPWSREAMFEYDAWWIDSALNQ